ncbi:MAG: hypothetical protein AB1772_01575 [Candidatus Zixiibacteriota bacterium]
MYRIEPAYYGFRVTSSGSFTAEEIGHLSRDLLTALKNCDRPFSLVIDSRKMVPPSPEKLVKFHDLHMAVWETICQRVAFILDSPVTKGQVLQMHYSSSPTCQDRVIDASRYPGWEERAIAWVADGIEPETTAALKPVSRSK